MQWSLLIKSNLKREEKYKRKINGNNGINERKKCIILFYYYYFICILSNKNDKIAQIYNSSTIHTNKTLLSLSYIFL